MILYFQAGKQRLAINTEKRTYNTNYFYLGGFKEYIKVSATDLKRIKAEIDFNCWDYEEDFYSFNKPAEVEEVPGF